MKCSELIALKKKPWIGDSSIPQTTREERHNLTNSISLMSPYRRETSEISQFHSKQRETSWWNCEKWGMPWNAQTHLAGKIRLQNCNNKPKKTGFELLIENMFTPDWWGRQWRQKKARRAQKKCEKNWADFFFAAGWGADWPLAFR